GTLGSTYDVATNVPNTMSGHVAGDFGELALNVTDTIGPLCGKFVSTHMQTRSLTAINSTLLDRSQREVLKLGGCPSSSLAKPVRNVTTGSSFATSTNASPGDVLEYRLSYNNSGLGAARNEALSDAVQPRQAFLNRSNS